MAHIAGRNDDVGWGKTCGESLRGKDDICIQLVRIGRRHALFSRTCPELGRMAHRSRRDGQVDYGGTGNELIEPPNRLVLVEAQSSRRTS